MATRYAPGGSVVERQVRDSRILVPLGSDNARIDNLYTLNPTAAKVWDQARKGLSDDEITARIVDDHDVDEATARRDVQELLGQLIAVGALVPAPDTRKA